jgi:hypothetical protein
MVSKEFGWASGFYVAPHRPALSDSDYYGDNYSVDSYGLDADLVLPQVDELNLANYANWLRW